MDNQKIHPLLDSEKQRQARRYEKEKRLLGLASTLLMLIVLLVFYHSGFSALLSQGVPGHSPFWTFLFYIATLQASLFFFTFPLSFYSGYVHEHRWDFSNQTVKSWLWEKIKSFLVGLVLMWCILGLLFWAMEMFAGLWWLAAGLGMALVSVVMATLFPVVILPIFNKYTPIENRELENALEDILERGGLRSSGFFKEDMSRQTKKENAFLAGLGKTRRVVLGDNLMDNMSIDEMKAILAHEVGHFRHRHMWKGIALGTVQQLIVFYAVDWLMGQTFPGFLTSIQENLRVFPYFIVFAGSVSGFLFGPLGKALSRGFEKQADLYALQNIAHPRMFLTALAGLADRNLSNAYPEWWAKLLYYSHPPIGERLEMAENFKG
jgi:STE24 endopeptidase